MNRKGFLEVCAGLLACVSLLAGCGNLSAVNGTVSGGENGNTLSIFVKNIPTDYTAALAADDSSSRSILPDNPYGIDDTATFHWILSGTAASGLAYTPTAISVTADENSTTAGKASLVNLGPYVWELTLTVYKTRDGSEGSYTYADPVLVGTASVDLRNGPAPVTFPMTTKGLATPGTVSISGTYTDGTVTTGTESAFDIGSNVAKLYTIGLYDRVTGDAVSDTVHTYTVADMTKPTTTNSWAFTYGAGTTADEAVSVAAGTYLFGVSFYKDTTASDANLVGYYSDLIVVDPGNALAKTGLAIDVIMTKPAAPSEFGAFLVNDSQTTDSYKVKLTWTDNSYNETNFVLKLTECAGAAPAASGDTTVIYGLTATGADKNYLNSSVCSSGSLLAGNTSCTLRLELGKVYEAALCAVNKAGASDYVARKVFSTTDTTLTAYGDPAGTPAQNISCMMIAYKLSGGSLTLASGGTAVTGTYYAYNIYKGADGTLIAPSSDAATYPNLTSTSGTFTKWVNETDDSTADAVTAYSYANKTVKAVFSTSGSVTTPTYTDLEAASIKLATATASDGDNERQRRDGNRQHG
jgi:hypothetical protein